MDNKEDLKNKIIDSIDKNEILIKNDSPSNLLKGLLNNSLLARNAGGFNKGGTFTKSANFADLSEISSPKIK